VGTVNKSHDTIDAAWVRRNSAQVDSLFRGAGEMLLRRRVSHGAGPDGRLEPSPASSPWIRWYPRDGFSSAGRHTSGSGARRDRRASSMAVHAMALRSGRLGRW